jgi:UDP-N-acetylglucosamine 4,6-dehydratase
MIPEDDARNTLEYDNYFAILPTYRDEYRQEYMNKNSGKPCPEDFRYSSDSNNQWLSVKDMRKMAGLMNVSEEENA